jgi:hypothetical protein
MRIGGNSCCSKLLPLKCPGIHHYIEPVVILEFVVISPTTSTSVSSVSSTFVSSRPKGTSSPTPASSLSIGAKAGIGVGSGVGSLALIAAGAYLGFIFHHRRNKNDKPQVGHSAPMPSHENVIVNSLISQPTMIPILPHRAVNPDTQPSYGGPSELSA